MFSAEKMQYISTSARENRLGLWKQLKFEITKRAYDGYYNFFLRPQHETLITTLRIFGFEVIWSEVENCWEVRW